MLYRIMFWVEKNKMETYASYISEALETITDENLIEKLEKVKKFFLWAQTLIKK